MTKYGISRRDFLAGAAAAATASWIAPARARPSSETRPNFLILHSDDQRFDAVGYMGVFPGLETPHMDALAEKSTRFTNAFVNTPICAPNRAILATGNLGRNNGVHRFGQPIPGPARRRGYNHVLHQAGYYTGMLGKYGLELDEGAEADFDFYDATVDQGPAFREIDGEEVHSSDWLADRTRDFFESVPEEQPFVATVNFKLPHGSAEPHPEDADLFSDIEYERFPTDDPDNLDRFPEVVQDSFNTDVYGNAHTPEEQHQEWMRNYLRKIVSLDRAVGRILDALEDTGHADNTVVILTSDHGHFMGEHGFGGKWLPYEEALRIPLFIHDPRKNDEGRDHPALAVMSDISPTLIDMAALEPDPDVDGKSLVPLLNNEAEKVRDQFLHEHYFVFRSHRSHIASTVGFRTERWKYIRYLNANPNVEHLYDLKNDPRETTNLAEEDEHQALLDDFRQQLRHCLLADVQLEYTLVFNPCDSIAGEWAFLAHKNDGEESLLHHVEDAVGWSLEEARAILSDGPQREAPCVLMRPQTNDGGETLSVVARWTVASDMYSTRARVTGAFEPHTADGAGAAAAVRFNGETLWEASMEPGSGERKDYDLEVEIEPGDVLEFVSSPEGETAEVRLYARVLDQEAPAERRALPRMFE